MTIDWIKTLNVFAGFINLCGTIAVLVGSWKMIFASQPGIKALSISSKALTEDSRAINIWKWLFGKMSIVDEAFEQWQPIIIPAILKNALRFLVIGILLQCLSALMFFIIYIVQ